MKTLEKKISAEHFYTPQKTLDSSLADLSNHPIVVKKVEKARATLERSPIPKDLSKKFRSGQ